jgi:hypothetical protein
MANTQPVVVIDHTTGNVSIIGETQTAKKDELASSLMKQAQTMKTAAVGTPPNPDDE